MASTGGEDWGNISNPLMRVGKPIFYAFLVYVAFFLFAVINAVTSLFVEATMTRAACDNIMAIHWQLEKKDKHIASLKEFFQELDVDQDGMISLDDFVAGIFRPRLQAFAACLGIDVYDTLAFFKTLSGNMNKLIDLETFVIGC